MSRTILKTTHIANIRGPKLGFEKKLSPEMMYSGRMKCSMYVDQIKHTNSKIKNIKKV